MNATMKQLREYTGLSQIKFAEYLNIPKRTIQGWEEGDRKPPEYLPNLIALAIGFPGADPLVMPDPARPAGRPKKSE